MKSKLITLLLITTSLLLLNSCSKNDIDENNNNNNNAQLTPTEQALVGKWKWVKTEEYYPNGNLYTVKKSDGSYVQYSEDGTLWDQVTYTIPSYYYCELLDETYYDNYTDSIFAVSFGIRAYKSYTNNNGYAANGMWWVYSNYGGSGKDYLYGNNGVGNFIGYIYTLTSTEIILRNNIDPNQSFTVIYYWEKM